MSTPTVASKNEVINSTDGLVDLIIVDLSGLGGSVYHLSPQIYADHSLISYGGQTYNFAPLKIDGFETKSLSTDLPRPTMTISNASSILLAPVTSLGDIVGATVTYTVTYASYLDAGANPDTSQYAARGVWRISAKTVETNQMIQFELASPLDMPNMMYPVRQYLIYPGINPPDGIYFPGIQPYRMDQTQSQ
jgi:lambda family phage minor tail protein L